MSLTPILRLPSCSPILRVLCAESCLRRLPRASHATGASRSHHLVRFHSLTNASSRNSFRLILLQTPGGVPPLVPASTSRRPRNPLTPLESALTDSSSRKSFRIRSYEKHRGDGGHIFQPKKVSYTFFARRFVFSLRQSASLRVEPGPLHPAPHRIILHELLPHETRPRILCHQQCDPQVDPQHVRVVPVLQRIECVDESISAPRPLAVLF